MKLVTEQKLLNFRRVEIWPFGEGLCMPYIQIDFVTLNPDYGFVAHNTGVVTVNANVKHLTIPEAKTFARAFDYAAKIADREFPANQEWRKELKAFFATLEPAKELA